MDEMLNKLDVARQYLYTQSIICFTMDVDWASEYALSQTLQYFHDHRIPLTVFVTHHSNVISNALLNGDIKCGIHPNFMHDSSQGKNYKEVVDYCFELLPDARIFRGHRYYEVNDTMELLSKRGIVCESNICTLMDVVPPFLHRSNMVSFPIFWEDGAFLYHYKNLDSELFFQRMMLPGLKVINIHPMHLMLNTPYFSYTREIKDRLSRNEWRQLNKKQIDNLRFSGNGIGTFIDKMLNFVEINKICTKYLEDVYDWINTL